MSHISQKPLKKETLKHINNQFLVFFGSFRLSHSSQNILKDLFTDTELLMLAKRLAVIFMLIEGYSRYRISLVLKVSPSTVTRMWRAYEGGEYRHVEKSLIDKKKREEFWQGIEKLLRGGMPPIVGKGRWKGIKKHK